VDVGQQSAAPLSARAVMIRWRSLMHMSLPIPFQSSPVHQGRIAAALITAAYMYTELLRPAANLSRYVQPLTCWGGMCHHSRAQLESALQPGSDTAALVAANRLTHAGVHPLHFGHRHRWQFATQEEQGTQFYYDHSSAQPVSYRILIQCALQGIKCGARWSARLWHALCSRGAGLRGSNIHRPPHGPPCKAK
jgi:hypothetical protein